MTFTPFARSIQHAQRYAQILEVLARHGFADLSRQLGLETLIERGRAILGAEPNPASSRIPLPQRLRLVLEELGPTYVKLGQVMSTRADLIPAEWVEEFKKLQNKVPGVEYDVIHKLLEEELPGGLKRYVRSIQKKTLAAGSMAQVHRARLRDGTRIVLKILRPGIRETTTTDMEILHFLAELIEARFANLGYSPTEVVKEFAKELRHEVDLMYEGRSTERLASLFEGDPDVAFPKVYWEATTHDVLAMDEMEGIPLANLKPGDLTDEERRKVVENGARAVFQQCLEHGFFHADPHPGNIVATPGGGVAFIDCGMVGQLDARTAGHLADLVAGAVSGDVDRVIVAAGAITGAEQEKLDDRSLRTDVHSIVSAFQGTPLERLNLGRILQDLFTTLRTHRIRCPADIILLIKALTTIESVARDLDPTFELVTFVRPYVEDLVHKRYSVSALKGRVHRSLLQYLELVEDLPAEVRPILAQLRRNRLAVNLEHRGLDRVTRAMEHASRNISLALIISAMLVGSSILILAARAGGIGAYSSIGIAGFIVAAVLVFLMILSNRRHRNG